jgi:Thioredoxin domain-containing protein
MNETKKLLYVLGTGVLILILVIITSVISANKGNKQLEKVEKLFESNKTEIVYLGRPTCGYCAMLEPSLKSLSKEFDFKYTYINTDEVNATNLSKILQRLDIDESSFGTPYIAIVKDGKIEAVQNGYVPENELFEFFKTNNIIDKDAKLSLNYIDYETYNNILEGDEKELVVLAQTGCSHCETAKPVLAEIAKEYDIKINILNISNFSEEEYNKFQSSLKYFKENEWGTPLTFSLEGDEILGVQEGSVTKEAFVEFFKKQKFIEN